jgi:hypothetical protein
MDLVKVLKNKSKQYDKDKKEGDKADKEHQKNMEEKANEFENIKKLMEKSGYNDLYDKIKDDLKSQGLKRGEIAKKVLEQIGTFDPKKDYHNFGKSKKIDFKEAKKESKAIRKTIDEIMKGMKVKLPKKKEIKENK